MKCPCFVGQKKADRQDLVGILLPTGDTMWRGGGNEVCESLRDRLDRHRADRLVSV